MSNKQNTITYNLEFHDHKFYKEIKRIALDMDCSTINDTLITLLRFGFQEYSKGNINKEDFDEQKKQK